MEKQLEQIRVFHAALSLNKFLNYPKQPKSNGVYSRNTLPKIKDGENVIILDEYKLIATHWIELYVNAENVTYFDSFGLAHIPKDIRTFIKNK